MSAARAGALLAALFVLAGCSTWTARRRADARLAGGDVETASAAYRDLLDGPHLLEPRDRLLFRAATAQALVDLEGSDTTASRALLEQLVAEHPASPYRASADLVLMLLDRADAAERDAGEARRAASRTSADERARRARLAELEADLEALRRENEMLKAIDLERPPAAPSP